MAEQKKVVGTIDLTPTWSGLIPLLLEVLEDQRVPADSKKDVRNELVRMASIADAAKELIADRKSVMKDAVAGIPDDRVRAISECAGDVAMCRVLIAEAIYGAMKP